MSATLFRSPAVRSRKARKVMCEALEDRRLMSLTIEVRNLDGSATATATHVGQVLNLEVLAVITDADKTPALDGVQDVSGNFVSSAVTGGAVAGNLVAANASPFNAAGDAAGKLQDLNHDGNIDVGIPFNATNTAGLFFARSNPIQIGEDTTGSISGNALTFKIATLQYTVTNLNIGAATDINFAPYVPPVKNGVAIADAAAWMEDGTQKDNVDGTFLAGTPYVVSNPAAAPTIVNEPVTGFADISQQIRVGYMPDVSVVHIDQLQGGINWGDGTSSAASFDRNKNGGIDISGTHTYAKPGTYKITSGSITETPSSGNGVNPDYIQLLGQVMTTAVVANTPDQIAAVAGKSFTTNVGAFTPGVTNLSYTAQTTWGDGVTSNGIVTGGTTSQTNVRITGTHSYQHAGTYIAHTLVYSHKAGSKAAPVLVEDFLYLVEVK